jgi:hypothetical protein
VLKENKMEEKNTEEIENKELNYELEDDSTEEKVEVVDDTPRS